MRYALISYGIVQKVLVWDGMAPYPLADGESLVPWEDAKDLPRVPPPTPTAEEVAEESEVTAIRATLAALKNGTGTAAERLARIERVVFRLVKSL